VFVLVASAVVVLGCPLVAGTFCADRRDGHDMPVNGVTGFSTDWLFFLLLRFDFFVEKEEEEEVEEEMKEEEEEEGKGKWKETAAAGVAADAEADDNVSPLLGEAHVNMNAPTDVSAALALCVSTALGLPVCIALRVSAALALCVSAALGLCVSAALGLPICIALCVSVHASTSGSVCDDTPSASPASPS